MTEKADRYTVVDPDDESLHQLQLQPMKGGRYNSVIKGPPGTEIGDLHIELEPYMEGEQPAMITHSGWWPDEMHVRMLTAGAHIRLVVYQHPIPPLAVAVEPPVCGCHGEPMTFDASDDVYTCSHVRTLGDPPPNTAALDSAHQEFKPQREGS